MDELIFEDQQNREPVEEAEEVFPDLEENNNQEPVETAEEVGFPEQSDSEPSAAEYVAAFGSDMVYEEKASVVPDRAGNTEGKAVSDPEYVPVIDEETAFSIEQIESGVNNMYSELQDIKEFVGGMSFDLIHIRNDVKQIGQNHIISSKVQSGITVALLGAIIVYMIFSKLR